MIRECANSALFLEIANETLATAGVFRFRASGRSMLPEIQDGEMLHVEPVPSRLKTGEIVLFNKDGKLKAHRIVGKRREGFIARGDAGFEADGLVRRDEIIGKVVAKECRRTGRVVALSGAKPRAAFFWRETKRWLRSWYTTRMTDGSRIQI